VQPDVSVIVVTWNGRQHLDTCLEKRRRTTSTCRRRRFSWTTGSTDGTVEYVRSRFPWVRLVRLDENHGFAGGNNIGVREAQGRFVAVSHNDTSADSGWLHALLSGIDEPGRVALATSLIVYMHDPDTIDSGR